MFDPISRDEENGSVLKAHLTTHGVGLCAGLAPPSLPRSIERRTPLVSVGGRVEETNGEGRSIAPKTSKTHFLQFPRLRAEHTRPIRAKGQFEAHKVKPP